jgi:hypothetical protein
MARETVLVTGASSGIGLELARSFAGGGSDLVLVARTRERLESLATELSERHGVSARVEPADLADPAAPAALAARLAAVGVAVDVLVNNAGFGALRPFAATESATHLEMVQVNVAALTELTHRFLPEMLERRRGGVLNVASTAGFQPGPGMAVYYATKAYVISFSEALSEEVRGSGVTVTCLCPGATATAFGERAGNADSLLFRLGAMSAAEVAAAAVRGFRAGKTLVVPGLRNKLGVAALRLAPRAFVRRVVARLNR